MTKSWSSLIAAASVSVTKRLTSARSLPARPSASRRFTMISGWLALWITTWDTSISKPGARTARQSIRPQVVTYVAGTLCNLCLRVGPRIGWSGRPDLNRRPHAPQACALPGCATPRPCLFRRSGCKFAIELKIISKAHPHPRLAGACDDSINLRRFSRGDTRTPLPVRSKIN